jgi:hypothetical protein
MHNDDSQTDGESRNCLDELDLNRVPKLSTRQTSPQMRHHMEHSLTTCLVVIR